MQTPRFCGAPCSAGVFVFSRLGRASLADQLVDGRHGAEARVLCRRGERGRYAQKAGKGHRPPPNHQGMVPEDVRRRGAEIEAPPASRRGFSGTRTARRAPDRLVERDPLDPGEHKGGVAPHEGGRRAGGGPPRPCGDADERREIVVRRRGGVARVGAGAAPLQRRDLLATADVPQPGDAAVGPQTRLERRELTWGVIRAEREDDEPRARRRGGVPTHRAPPPRALPPRALPPRARRPASPSSAHRTTADVGRDASRPGCPASLTPLSLCRYSGSASTPGRSSASPGPEPDGSLSSGRSRSEANVSEPPSWPISSSAWSSSSCW